MAKVKFTAVVADMRNKLNGSVFARNRGGAYVRTKVTPLNPQTSAQITARNTLTQLAQGFRSLSQEQIAAWNGAVSQWQKTDIFGDLVSPTGLALYVRLNANIINAGGSEIPTPPMAQGAQALENLSVDVFLSPDSITLQFEPSVVPTNHAMYVEATEKLSLGINNANSRFRKIAVLTPGTESGADITNQYIAKFGSFPNNGKIFVRAKLINRSTGEVSQALKRSAIAIA